MRQRALLVLECPVGDMPAMFHLGTQEQLCTVDSVTNFTSATDCHCQCHPKDFFQQFECVGGKADMHLQMAFSSCQGQWAVQDPCPC